MFESSIKEVIFYWRLYELPDNIRAFSIRDGFPNEEARDETVINRTGLIKSYCKEVR